MTVPAPAWKPHPAVGVGRQETDVQTLRGLTSNRPVSVIDYQDPHPGILENIVGVPVRDATQPGEPPILPPSRSPTESRHIPDLERPVPPPACPSSGADPEVALPPWQRRLRVIPGRRGSALPRERRFDGRSCLSGTESQVPLAAGSSSASVQTIRFHEEIIRGQGNSGSEEPGPVEEETQKWKKTPQ